MTFSFCGYAIDLIRSCYTTRMRLYRDSEEETEVKWFFVDDDTPVLPFYTRFASGNWARERFSWSGPGEVLGAPRPWRNGSALHDEFDASHLCGDAERFANGAWRHPHELGLLELEDGGDVLAVEPGPGDLAYETEPADPVLETCGGEIPCCRGQTCSLGVLLGGTSKLPASKIGAALSGSAILFRPSGGVLVGGSGLVRRPSPALALNSTGELRRPTGGLLLSSTGHMLRPSPAIEIDGTGRSSLLTTRRGGIVLDSSGRVRRPTPAIEIDGSSPAGIPCSCHRCPPDHCNPATYFWDFNGGHPTNLDCTDCEDLPIGGSVHQSGDPCQYTSLYDPALCSHQWGIVFGFSAPFDQWVFQILQEASIVASWNIDAAEFVCDSENFLTGGLVAGTTCDFPSTVRIYV